MPNHLPHPAAARHSAMLHHSAAGFHRFLFPIRATVKAMSDYFDCV
jgi:hypothetical protein